MPIDTTPTIMTCLGWAFGESDFRGMFGQVVDGFSVSVRGCLDVVDRDVVVGRNRNVVSCVCGECAMRMFHQQVESCIPCTRMSAMSVVSDQFLLSVIGAEERSISSN